MPPSKSQPELQDGSDSPNSGVHLGVYPPRPGITPLNNILIHRFQSDVEGTWVLDPSIWYPSTIIQPVKQYGVVQKVNNLDIKISGGYCSLNATVFITPTEEEDALHTGYPFKKVPRIRFRVQVIDSKERDPESVLKIHDLHSPAGMVRRRIHISLDSYRSRFVLQIPPSFRGIAKLEMTGSGSTFSLSKSLNAAATTISEVNRKFYMLIGPCEPALYADPENIDEIEIAFCNSVHLAYSNESPLVTQEVQI